jgi:GNAT superfamily N-acetyltransferase
MKRTLRDLAPGEYPEAYEIMVRSFPRVELRGREEERALLEKLNYRFLVAPLEGGSIGGLLTVWDFEEFRFVEHLAVRQELRGTGIGSRMMREYLDSEDKPAWVEVDGAETVEAKRRIAFYERLGFILSEFGYPQPALQDAAEGVFLRIMTCPCGVTESQFLHVKEKVFSCVYDQPCPMGTHLVSQDL